MFFLVIAVQVA